MSRFGWDIGREGLRWWKGLKRGKGGVGARFMDVMMEGLFRRKGPLGGEEGWKRETY